MASADAITGPINLGNPSECTIGELATTIIDLVGSRSRIAYKPLPTDDPKQRCPDIREADKTLGWRSTVALQDGMSDTVAYFDAMLSGAGKHSTHAN